MKLYILSLILAIYLISGTQAANCPDGVRVRKDYRDLSDQEWQAFIKAINNLRNSRDGNISKFESFSKLHADFMGEAHTDANFGWWHRIYLRQYEDALIAANPDFKALPFWDWSADYALPHKATIFESKYLGGSAADGINGSKCIPDGPFANSQLSFPDRHCLSRGFSRQSGRSSAYPNANGQVRFYSPAELTQLMNSQSSFDDFHETLQYAIHSTPHAYIGGVGGEMYYINRAPNDPVFTMHHVYIDALLDLWQTRHPNTRYNDASYRAFNGAKASTVFKLAETCVKYEPYSGFNKPKPPVTTTTSVKSTTTTTKSSTSSVASSSSASTSSSASQSTSSGASTTTSSASTGASTSASSATQTSATSPSTSATPTSTPTASNGSTSSGQGSSSTSSLTASSSSASTTSAAGTGATQTATATTSSGTAKPTQTVDPYKPNKEQSQYYKDTFYGKSPACPYLPPPDSYLPPPPPKFVEENMYPKERVQKCVERMEKVVEEVKKQADEGVYLPPAVPATAVMVDQSAGNGQGPSSSARALVASAVPAAAVALVAALFAM